MAEPNWQSHLVTSGHPSKQQPQWKSANPDPFRSTVQNLHGSCVLTCINHSPAVGSRRILAINAHEQDGHSGSDRAHSDHSIRAARLALNPSNQADRRPIGSDHSKGPVVQSWQQTQPVTVARDRSTPTTTDVSAASCHPPKSILPAPPPWSIFLAG
ncbi:hypothetical protein ACLOJK_007337 [Asimina triloba]